MWVGLCYLAPKRLSSTKSSATELGMLTREKSNGHIFGLVSVRIGALYLVRTLASSRRHFSWLSGVSRRQASAIAWASGEEGVLDMVP